MNDRTPNRRSSSRCSAFCADRRAFSGAARFDERLPRSYRADGRALDLQASEDTAQRFGNLRGDPDRPRPDPPARTCRPRAARRRAVVAERRHREPRQRLQRRFVVERRREDRAGLREEPLLLLDAAPFGDVDEDADRAAHLAVGVEQAARRIPSASSWLPSRADDSTTTPLTSMPSSRLRYIGRSSIVSSRPSLSALTGNGSERRSLSAGMAAALESEQSRQRTVDARGAAQRIVGNRDPDRQDVQDRLDLSRTLLQIRTKLTDELEGLKWHARGRPLHSTLVCKRAAHS